MRDREPVLAIAAIALAATGWTWRWYSLVTDPRSSHLSADTGVVQLASVGVVTAVLLVLLAGAVAIVLDAGTRPWRCLLGVGAAAVLALPLVILMGGALDGGALRLGVALTGLFAVTTVAVVRPQRRAVSELGLVAAIWFGAFAIWWLVRIDVAPSDLVWDGSDQATYLRIGGQVVRFHFLRVPYLLGLPLMLEPSILAAGGLAELPAGVQTANIVNLLLLPATLGLLMPAGLLFTSRAAIAGSDAPRKHVTIALGAAVAAVLLLGYATAAPDFLSTREAGLVARRIVGLVYAPESLSMVYLAGLLLVLARSTDRAARWSPAAVGVATAVAVMVREYNAVLALLFVLALVTIPHRRRDALVTGGVAALAFVPQLLHWQLVYGSWFFPNRLVLWEDSGRAERWRPVVEQRYGWSPVGDPPQVSPHYVTTNLGEWFSNYGIVLAAVTGLALVLLVVRRAQWRLWGFCGAVLWGTVVFDAAYINIEVTYRYNAIVLPAVAALIAAALLVALTPFLERDPGPSPTSRAKNPSGGGLEAGDEAGERLAEVVEQGDAGPS